MSEKKDGGLFGWREWDIKLPVHPQFIAETKPSKRCDGSYTGDEFYSYDKPVDNYVNSLYNPVAYPNLSPAWTLHSQFISPWIKTVFTDMSGSANNTAGLHCEKFELNALECMEYYGINQGLTACKDAYDDLMECKFMTKRILRVRHMYKKRNIDNWVEYMQGKRTYEETFEQPPKLHAYLSPYQDPNTQCRSHGGMT